MHLTKSHLIDETILLPPKQVHFLGPGLVLTRCVVVSHATSRNLVIVGARLEECTFETKTTLEDHRWCSAELISCRFVGRFFGCDFGACAEPGEPAGVIHGADFSQALIDGCQFFDCDLDSMVFAPWPTFMMRSPQNAASDLLDVDWPGSTRFVMEAAAESPAEVTAVVWNAELLCARAGVPLDELRRLFAGLPRVFSWRCCAPQ